MADLYKYVPAPLCPKDRTRLRFLYVISYPKPDAIQLECGRCKTPYLMRMTIDRHAIEDLNRAS